ncbi:UNVERIFIED_CONTAM: hypothetical protein FKN15_072384 [Acipenser sinensis]
MACIDYHWKQPEQRGAISCPQCRYNFSPKPVLRKNFVLADVVERLKQTGLSPSLSAHSLTGTGHVPCDFCTGRKLGAVRSCLTCSASYCPEHLKPHFTVLSFKRHQLVEATGDLSQTLCQQHHRPLEVFCRTDWSFVCLLCAATKHRSHCTVTPEDERASTQAVELHSCVWWKEGVRLAKLTYDTLKAWIPKREASASQLRYIAQQLERLRREANYSRKVRGLAAVGAFVSAVCTAGLGAPLLGAVAGGVAVTTAMTAIWGVPQRVDTETDKEAAKEGVRLMKELDKMAERIAASQRCVDSPEPLGKEHVFTRLVSAGLFAGTTLLTARNVNKMAFLMGKLARNMRAISVPGETAACGPRGVIHLEPLGKKGYSVPKAGTIQVAVELHSCVWWKEGVRLAKLTYDRLKAWIPKREASASQLRYIAQQLERMRREANYSRKVRGLAAVGAFVSAVCTAGLGAPLLGAVAGGVAGAGAMTAIWGVAQRVESFKTSDCMKTARKITETDKEAAKEVVRLMKELDKMAERIAASQRCVDSPEPLGKEHVFTRLVSAGLFAGTTLLTARNVNKMAFLMGKLAKNMRAISVPGETAACGPRVRCL